ncbi:MAG: MFS transporter, partial [Candidatus Dormibacteraeota bacterium]|nr:MFS transporter [Candidatus Dormibacteraeota bacterium]
VVALPLAAVADRRHRGPVAALGIVGFSAAALVSALAPGLSALAGARLVAVGFETLVAAIATSAAVEAVSASSRGKAVSLVALGGGAGAALSVLVYPLVAPHWRLLYAIAALGLPLAPIALLLPSPGAPTISSGVRLLLLRPPWRSRLTVLGIGAGCGALLSEPANFFSVFFGSRRLAMSPASLSVLVAASGAAAVAGYIAGGVATDRLGRRLPAVVLLVVAAGLTALSFTPSAAIYVVMNILWSAAAGAVAPVVAAWTVELVPTRARVTAVTATAVAGALGGVLGLRAVAGLEPALGLSATLWGAAAVAILGTLALLTLPETRGRPLPE